MNFHPHPGIGESSQLVHLKLDRNPEPKYDAYRWERVCFHLQRACNVYTYEQQNKSLLSYNVKARALVGFTWSVVW